ncbi:MAG: leucine-rich repeat domain-containing protein [Firmicutes bacterium]|nr:leucine-rich repeat domain-containing protein [Bacillota bacterium]
MKKFLLIAVLVIVVAGAGIGGYFLFIRDNNPTFNLTHQLNLTGVTNIPTNLSDLPRGHWHETDTVNFPMHDDYWFDGWFKDAALTQFAINFNVNQNVTLHARWVCKTQYTPGLIFEEWNTGARLIGFTNPNHATIILPETVELIIDDIPQTRNVIAIDSSAFFRMTHEGGSHQGFHVRLSSNVQILNDLPRNTTTLYLANATTINQMLLAGTTHLSTNMHRITLNPGNTMFTVEDYVLYQRVGLNNFHTLRFYFNRTNEEFKIPEGVVTLAYGAFSVRGSAHDHPLTSLTFPKTFRNLAPRSLLLDFQELIFLDGMTHLEADFQWYGFSNEIITGHLLTNVVLPNTLQVLDLNAFRHVNWRGSEPFVLNIPASVQTIIPGGGMNNNNMILNVHADNTNFTSINGDVYSFDTLTLVAIGTRINRTNTGRQYPYTVRPGTQIIGTRALANMEHDWVLNPLPDSVTTLEHASLAANRGMTTFTIPRNLVNWNTPMGTTNGTNHIATFSVHPQNTNFSAINGHLFSADGTILYQHADGRQLINQNYRRFVIPNTVTTIRTAAFISMGSGFPFQEVFIPSSVINIEEHALEGFAGIQREIDGEWITESGRIEIQANRIPDTWHPNWLRNWHPWGEWDNRVILDAASVNPLSIFRLSGDYHHLAGRFLIWMPESFTDEWLASPHMSVGPRTAGFTFGVFARPNAIAGGTNVRDVLDYQLNLSGDILVNSPIADITTHQGNTVAVNHNIGFGDIHNYALVIQGQFGFFFIRLHVQPNPTYLAFANSFINEWVKNIMV